VKHSRARIGIYDREDYGTAIIAGRSRTRCHASPSRFEEFNRPKQVVENLKVFIQAAKQRAKALDHVLSMALPAGKKTTLSIIIANELESYQIDFGTYPEKAADLAGILTNLNERDSLHRRNP